MGMDLYIDAYNKQVNERIELCYARKFWGLWYFFCFNGCFESDYDYVLYLTPEAWDRFIKTVEPKIGLIKAARDIYWNMWDSNEYDYTFTDEQKKVIQEYEEWYDGTFCFYSTTLGIDFDINALVAWYEAKDEVWKYLCDDNYDVVIINSF